MKDDNNQSYYWTDEWQVGELEADEDIRLGKVKQFNTLEELIEDLHNV